MLAVRVAGVISASCEALLPSLCLHCGEPIGGAEVGLCGDCWATVIPQAGGSCPSCGVPVAEADEPCLGCIATPPEQTATVVWGDYDGPLRSAVLAMKRRGRDELARPIGRRLAARLAFEPWVAEVDLVTHVPSHPFRRLRNGWSAAACTARVVAHEIALPARRCLSRHGLARQTGRSRAQRLRLPTGTFSAAAGVRGQRLLVVDDVMTTGTTLRRAARAARQAGCRAVYCAVIARAPEPRSLT